MCAGGGALAERFGLRESEGAKRDTPEWEAPRKLVTSMPSQMAELFAQIAPEAEVIAVSLS
jgi:hypothetical protein